jgi:hypothetical protein
MNKVSCRREMNLWIYCKNAQRLKAKKNLKYKNGQILSFTGFIERNTRGTACGKNY